MGTRLTVRFSNSTLYKKCGFIPLSRAIATEKLRWLGHVLWMKDDRLLKIAVFGQPSRAKPKTNCPRFGWEDVTERYKESG